jgi:alkylation response protein AidB-like acyl-CoA dehydrogenase
MTAAKTGCDPTTFFDSILPAAETRASYSDFPFAWGEVDTLFRTARRFPGSYFQKLEEVRAKAREFSERYVRPAALEIERKVSADHDYFAWDLMRQACRCRFFSMIIPEAFEGVGLGVLHMAAMAEELAVGCAGVASTIGVHSAGISCGLLSLDAFILEKYIKPVAQAEKRGEPILWGGAVTEPLAGTDIWDEDFIKLGKIVTFAKKVPGGYKLTGRKRFISNGSVARFVVLAAAVDPRAVAESWTAFLVDTRTPGFSVGRVERKMGQKASPAAELVLEDVFVPDECRLGIEGRAGRYISVYLAGSRGPVGAIGVGCARRSLQSLIEWAQQKKTRHGRLIDQQAVQLAISRMSSEIAAARALYVASCLFCDEIFFEMIGGPAQKAALALLPHGLLGRPAAARLLQSKTARRATDWALGKIVPDDRLAHISRLATAAKVMGSETGVRVSGEVARLMGPDALDPRWPVEKAWRDAKLTMIYEGTNQANLITHFKDLARTMRRT